MGDLAIKGPQVMAGYWQKCSGKRKRSSRVMVGLLTGDIVSVNQQGYVQFVSARKT